MENNPNAPINCENGELNPPIGMAGAGQEDSEVEDGLDGTAFTREFQRGFKAGRESAQKIEWTSQGAPHATAEQFHKQWDASQINAPSKYYWYNMADAKSRHVVLLEALRHTLPILIGAIAFVDCKAVVAEVRAAIKQAERT